MSDVELLSLAHEEFGTTLAAVRPAHWGVPTPCDGWAVSDLVGHAVCGELLSTALLGGATSDAAIAGLPTLDLDEAQRRYGEITSACTAAFAEPGALDRIVHHPMGEIPASRMLGFRVGDMTLHRWDLARAIGTDDVLDPRLVQAVWDQLQPVAPFISTLGVFGAGPSGEVAADDDLQRRLLDLTGRRP